METILEILETIEFSYPNDDQYGYSIPAGLTLARDESWCIYGVSGSGKSTLMTLLACLRRFNQGAIRYRFGDDQRIDISTRTWDARVGPALWRRIGFAFQQPELIRALSVQDNLKLVGNEAPDGLFSQREWDHICHSRVWRVSGGQVQRLGLVRALGGDQDLVFLDEPTNNLDKRNRSSVARFVKTCSQGRALVVVCHDDDFIKTLAVDKVFEIEEQPTAGGRIRRTLNLVEEHSLQEPAPPRVLATSTVSLR